MIYKKSEISRLRKLAMKTIRGAKSVAHIRPRALCIAKIAPGCAVFATPWMDSEPQVKEKEFSSYREVRGERVYDVKIGDWCSLAYVVTSGCSDVQVLEILG